MTVTFSDLLRHAMESLRAPREQTRWVMTHAFSHAERWWMLALVSVVSTILSVALEFLLTGVPAFPLGLVQVSPVTGAIATLSNAVITVFLVYWAGRAFGGTGGFGNTISVIAWLQFILTGILAVQVLIALLLPAMLGPVNILALVALGWLFCNFVAELHGFRSALSVFLATMAIALGLVLVLYLMAGSMGLAATGVSI